VFRSVDELKIETDAVLTASKYETVVYT